MKSPNEGSSPKNSYRSPQLVVYGRIQELTRKDIGITDQNQSANPNNMSG